MSCSIDLDSPITHNQYYWLLEHYNETVDYTIVTLYDVDEYGYETNDIISDSIIFDKECDAIMFTLSCL